LSGDKGFGASKATSSPDSPENDTTQFLNELGTRHQRRWELDTNPVSQWVGKQTLTRGEDTGPIPTVHRVSKRYLESAGATTSKVTTDGDQAKTDTISTDDRYGARIRINNTPNAENTNPNLTKQTLIGEGMYNGRRFHNPSPPPASKRPPEARRD
jgi:hypothetical protein